MPPIILRTTLPMQTLHTRFLEAIAEGRDVDLVVEGRRVLLLPEVIKRIRLGGRDAAAASLMGLPLFPQVVVLLLEARRLGRTFSCRRVHGAKEAVVEVRLPTTI